MSTVDLFHTAAYQLRTLPLDSSTYDDLLGKALFLLNNHAGRHLSVRFVASLGETLPGLLERYSKTGNFSCLFVVLQCAVNLMIDGRMELAESLVLGALKHWLSRSVKESNWGNVRDMYVVIDRLASYFSMNLHFEKADSWWEVGFVLLRDFSGAVKPVSRFFQLFKHALKSCSVFRIRSTSRKAFGRWFLRFVLLYKEEIRRKPDSPISDVRRAASCFIQANAFLSPSIKAGSPLIQFVEGELIALGRRFFKDVTSLCFTPRRKLYALSLVCALQSKTPDTQAARALMKVVSGHLVENMIARQKCLRKVFSFYAAYRHFKSNTSLLSLVSGFLLITFHLLSNHLSSGSLADPQLVDALSSDFELSAEASAEEIAALTSEHTLATTEEEEEKVFKKLVKLVSKNTTG